jgi:hypothetical protein
MVGANLVRNISNSAGLTSAELSARRSYAQKYRKGSKDI